VTPVLQTELRRAFSREEIVLRVENHPILGPAQVLRTVEIEVDDRKIKAREGEPIAAALLANGITTFRYTNRFNSPRGLYCAIGRCSDCLMKVDGVPNVRVCVTPVRAGMVIKTQFGRGGVRSSADDSM
jgi:predicted molibdopterin-dependent oxidoreductase YjgC